MLPVQDVKPSNIDRMQQGEFVIGRWINEPIVELELVPEKYEELDLESTSPDSGENGVDPEDNTESTLDAGLYLDFIMKSPAYSWLVASVQREAAITRAAPDMMEEIRKTVLCSLPPFHKVTRKASPQEYKATFEINWDPLSFVKEQQFSESTCEALERAITLTGSVNNAQAVTTGEYLSQTWPATGKHIMQLVTDVVRNTVDFRVTCECIIRPH
jgi:hypothetical protein